MSVDSILAADLVARLRADLDRMELAALRAIDRMKARGIVAGNHSESTQSIMESASEMSKTEIANVRKGEINWRVD